MSDFALLETAVAHHSEGRLRDAEALYAKYLDDHPDHPDALHLRGVALFQLNEAENAEPLLRKAIAINSNEADYHSNLGLVLQDTGRLNEALEAFRIAVALQPDFREALISLARLELKLKLSADAASTFRRIVGIDETDTSLLRDFVAALIENNELPEAEQLCNQALAIDPANVDSLVSLGHLQQAMNLPDVAATTYLAALKIDPFNVRATNNIGTICMNRNEPQNALDWFLNAVRLDGEFVEAMFNAGVAYQELGNVDSAANYFNAALSKKKDLPRAYRYLSEIYRVSGRSELQQRTLKAWLEVSPDSATAKHLLAASQGDSGVLRASDDFIREEFDDFADSFDERLKKLDYATPAKLIDLLGRQEIAARGLDRALDAGCGTGLCGNGIRRFAKTIVGVDLSGKMLEQASQLEVYSELIEDELDAYMRSRPLAFDLVVSADTLVYFGALESVLEAAAITMNPSGILAFSVELSKNSDADDYRLQNSGRYCHSRAYVVSCLSDAGFEVLVEDATAIRIEANKPVTGLLVVARLLTGDSG